MSRANEILGNMTLEEKVAQMICVRAFGFLDKVSDMLKNGRMAGLGAVVMTNNGIKDLEKVVEAVNEYRRTSRLPLYLYIDGECGIADMFNFGTKFPSMMALGATFSKELAYKCGYVIGKEAAALGFMIISNPDLDINTNPNNPIIKTRSMSDNPDLIIELAKEYVRGTQEAGMVTTGKHFPGHGDTSQDSHVEMPRVEYDREFLMGRELKPFKELIDSGMWGIMTAHILYPSLLDENEEMVPATLSRSIIYKILREEFGFKGLIVSDSLAMRGIKDNYGIEKSAVMALKAGHDIILQDYASDPEITYNAVLEAAKSGEIDRHEIDASVGRILGFMEKLELLDNRPVDLENAAAVIACSEHRDVSREIADKSVTLLEAADIPKKILDDARILVVATKSAEEGNVVKDMHANITSKAGYLYSRCKQYSSNVKLFTVGEDPDEGEISELKGMMVNFDYIIYGTFVRIISYKAGSGSIPEAQANLMNYLNEARKDTSFIIFGNPYITNKLDRLNNCLCTYGDCEFSIDAALKVIFGEMKASGKLPIHVNERYTYGYGL